MNEVPSFIYCPISLSAMREAGRPEDLNDIEHMQMDIK